MPDGAFDVQKAVYDRLAAASGLTALLAAGDGSIFDHVPRGSAFPYVAIGEMRLQPLDTQGGDGSDIDLSIHSFARGTGHREVRALMSAIHAALHDAAFPVANRTLVLCRLIAAESAMEGDGETYHGLQRFQIITEPA
jgi:hypothetical protein